MLYIAYLYAEVYLILWTMELETPDGFELLAMLLMLYNVIFVTMSYVLYIIFSSLTYR